MWLSLGRRPWLLVSVAGFERFGCLEEQIWNSVFYHVLLAWGKLKVMGRMASSRGVDLSEHVRHARRGPGKNPLSLVEIRNIALDHARGEKIEG